MNETHKSAAEQLPSVELPGIGPARNGQSEARMYVNKKSSQAITKEFLGKRLAEMASEYGNGGRKLRSRQSVSTSVLDPLLMGTMKKLEVRRNPFKEQNKQRKEDEGKQQHPPTEAIVARRSLPREKLLPSKELLQKPRSDSIIKPNTHHFDSVMNEFIFTVNLSNGLAVNNRKDSTFRAFIDKGNNGLLLKSVVKRRWWWHLVDDVAECNLLWTQWNTRDFTQKLPALGRDNSGMIKTESEESQKQLGSLKSTVRMVVPLLVMQENMQQKVSKISRLINLQAFQKLNLKVSPQQDYYYVFGRKLMNQTPMELVKGVYCIRDEPLSLESQQTAHIHNHVDGVLNLHSKKLLLSNLRKFYTSKGVNPYQHIPLTFHIKEGTSDEQFMALVAEFQAIEKHQPPQPAEQQPPSQEKQAVKRVSTKKLEAQAPRNVWICKPGENSNRGNGITVVDKLQQLIELARSLEASTVKRSLIIQKYIENPFLIEKRKFDIRCYILITTYNGCVKGYWFEQGYIRTASEEYTLEDVSNKLVHLTNDAIQKKGKEYGRFQSANKMSFAQFQEYLNSKTKNPKGKFGRSYEQMKGIAKDLIESVHLKLNPKHKQFAFELFGLDFMLDSALKPWLIEANSNPCLDTTGPLLGRLIPEVVQNVFKVAIDPIFPPPNVPPKTKLKTREDYFERNRFTLIFDSLIEQPQPAPPTSAQSLSQAKPSLPQEPIESVQIAD